jgi:hypothetical protein
MNAIRYLLKRGLSLMMVFVMYAGLLLTASPVQAAVGSNLRQIHGGYSQPCSINTGLAFDGTNLLVTCWYHNVIDVLAPGDGHLVSTLTVPGYGGLFAAAWDGNHNKLLLCADENKVILVDTSNGSSTFLFSGPECVDGLAYDGTDDTVWLSPDVSGTVYHYKTDGTLINSHSVSGLIGGCGNSGIAVGGSKLYLANNGCSQIFEVAKDFSTSSLLSSFPARLEDLECDDVSFAGAGKGAIWSIDAYDRVINAWEIPVGKCGRGGRPACTMDPSVGWVDPLSATVTANMSIGSTVPIKFSYGSCATPFIHDESVVIVVRPEWDPNGLITAWVYGADIVIDDAAHLYSVDFHSGRYGLCARTTLSVDVYINDHLAGRALVYVTP